MTIFIRFSLPFVLALAVLANASAQSTGSSPKGSAPGSPSGGAGANSGGAGAGGPGNASSSTTGAGAPPSAASLATDPSYRLSAGDQIVVSIYDEPELTSHELIDREGIAKLTLLKETKLAGMTVRDAEKAIAALYIERQILKKPEVKLVVNAFAPREVMLIGEVKNPGGLSFPRDLTSMDIVEVISRAGGFTVRARSNAVTVMRKSADGSTETSKIVNVEAMMSGRTGPEQRRLEFPIYPGDRLIIAERYF